MTEVVNDRRLRAIARSCPEFNSAYGNGTGAMSATAGEVTSEITCSACVHFRNGRCNIYENKVNN